MDQEGPSVLKQAINDYNALLEDEELKNSSREELEAKLESAQTPGNPNEKSE